MNYTLTRHAEKVLAERGIRVEWMQRTLTAPDWTEPDPNDPQVVRYFRAVPEFGGRVLRVVVNPTPQPVLIVSVFFDRSAKGKP